MALLTWDGSLSVGLSSIDTQHQRWFDLINKLHDAMKLGKGKEVLQPLLNEVFEFTSTHFSAEEKLMVELNYPGYLHHKKQHETFIARMQEIQHRHQSGAPSLTAEVMATWKDWLLSHVQTVDKQYGPFFKSKGVD